MTNTAPRRSTWILAGLLVFAVVFGGYWWIRHGWLRVQSALAEEQTLYFQEAREKGLQSSHPEEFVWPGSNHTASGHQPPSVTFKSVKARQSGRWGDDSGVSPPAAVFCLCSQ
jgi:hypothetical protein